MERQADWLEKRKKVATAGAVIIGIVGAVGIAMGYALFFKSYTDYPKILQHLLAFMTAATIEGGLMWFTYNLLNSAATTSERVASGVSVFLLLAVIATNMATHQAIVRKANMVAWQTTYISYVGPAVIILVAALIIIQLYLRHENAEAYRDRQTTVNLKRRVDQLETEIVDSDDFEDWFKKEYKDLAYDRAVRRVGLPSKPNVKSLPRGYDAEAEIVTDNEQPRRLPANPDPAATTAQTKEPKRAFGFGRYRSPGSPSNKSPNV